MGSPNKFEWLITANVTFHKKATKRRYEIPLRLKPRDFTSLFTR